jgi:hypothetical protein
VAARADAASDVATARDAASAGHTRAPADGDAAPDTHAHAATDRDGSLDRLDGDRHALPDAHTDAPLIPFWAAEAAILRPTSPQEGIPRR